MLFADSEGSAGIVGANLRDALLLLAALPCAGQALHLERQGRIVGEAMLLALREEEDEELSEGADMDDLPPSSLRRTYEGSRPAATRTNRVDLLVRGSGSPAHGIGSCFPKASPVTAGSESVAVS
ncbi:hypothetical protein ABZ467_36215 [Streptomyces sp. NPDC005727]|uniref:hypothetical protein n=1 Tax=Streptomyces sp. NPDC005727 TaxID=3157053 RepID=UPI0033EF530B